MGNRLIGSTFYFLEAPTGESEVLQWFRNLESPPELSQAQGCQLLYFRNLGPLRRAADGSPDATTSPVVTLFWPQVVRGVFWTVGEVRFLTKTREIPGIDSIVRAFRQWINGFEIVFEQFPKPALPFDYYLEGSIRNIAPKIYALPSGRAALDQERYFISQMNSEGDLSTLCQTLRLRGVICE